MRRSRVASPVVLLAAMSLASAAAAQLSPQDRERQVNAFTTGSQSSSAVAADPQGNFVVVWQSVGSVAGDSSLLSIQAQRYDRLGRKVGSQSQVNTYTTNAQQRPSVGLDAGGNWVVVWESEGSSQGDTSGRSVHGQRVAANGAPLGAEFQVNTYTSLNQYYPGVAVAPDGSFLVVWESDGSPESDSISTSIQARFYDVAGLPSGNQFQVNVVTTGFQELPAVAAAGTGDFVVAWKHNGAGVADPLSVQAMLVAAGGAPAGAQFQVNSYSTGTQTTPAVAADGSGNFVVAWQSLPGGAETEIEAAIFDPAGVPISGEFQVNSYSTLNQAEPSVASSPQGDFVIAWKSLGSAGGDTHLDSVHARRYDADGSARGAEFQANTYTTGNQMLPAVAMDGTGNFVLAWESDGSFDDDASGKSVQQRRFDALFRDGFEVGTTARWSAAVP